MNEGSKRGRCWLITRGALILVFACALCLVFLDQSAPVSNRPAYEPIHRNSCLPVPERTENGTRTWLDRVLFIITTGAGTQQQRIDAQHAAWARFVPAENILRVSDLADCDLHNVITYPEVEGKPTHYDSSYRPHAALLRSYQSDRLADIDWVLSVDDDTWVNLHSLRDFLALQSPEHPVEIGWLFPGRTRASGGAGILLSREAAQRIAAAFISGECVPAPEDYHDQFWGTCVLACGGRTVHSSLFDPAPPPTQDYDLLCHPRKAAITYHHLDAETMGRLGREFAYDSDHYDNICRG